MGLIDWVMVLFLLMTILILFFPRRVPMLRHSLDQHQQYAECLEMWAQFYETVPDIQR